MRRSWTSRFTGLQGQAWAAYTAGGLEATVAAVPPTRMTRAGMTVFTSVKLVVTARKNACP